MHMHLGVDVFLIAPGLLRSERKLVGDFFVPVSLGQQVEHLGFTHAEAFDFVTKLTALAKKPAIRRGIPLVIGTQPRSESCKLCRSLPGVEFFMRYPPAPASSAGKTNSSSFDAVRIKTRVSGGGSRAGKITRLGISPSLGAGDLTTKQVRRISSKETSTPMATVGTDRQRIGPDRGCRG